MIKKRRIAVVLLTIALFIGSCATLEQLIQKPQITFDRLDFREMSLLEGTFMFRFNIANPNPVGVRLDDILYDFDINGSRFLSSRLDQGLNLVASGTAPLEIPLTINYLDAFNSLSAFIRSDALDYRLNGSAAVGPVRLPFSKSGSIDVPKIPDITVKSISIDRLSVTGASLKLALGMKNSNAFAVTMDGLEYAAWMGDVELAKGVAGNVRPLAANGQSTMDLDVDLNFLQLGRGVQALLSGSSAPCRLTGNMLVNTLSGVQKIPFQFDGKVPITK
jgi:LEA14-like dessication related protein